jgi:HTH-type transcriptional regulator/antitoxin HigA
MSELIKQAIEDWPFVSPLVCKPETERDYAVLVQTLDELLDHIRGDESNPLMSLMEIIGDWIEAYDLGR